VGRRPFHAGAVGWWERPGNSALINGCSGRGLKSVERSKEAEISAAQREGGKKLRQCMGGMAVDQKGVEAQTTAF